jgi:hypothetical protein
LREPDLTTFSKGEKAGLMMEQEKNNRSSENITNKSNIQANGGNLNL